MWAFCISPPPPWCPLAHMPTNAQCPPIFLFIRAKVFVMWHLDYLSSWVRQKVSTEYNSWFPRKMCIQIYHTTVYILVKHRSTLGYTKIPPPHSFIVERKDIMIFKLVLCIVGFFCETVILSNCELKRLKNVEYWKATKCNFCSDQLNCKLHFTLHITLYTYAHNGFFLHFLKVWHYSPRDSAYHSTTHNTHWAKLWPKNASDFIAKV